MLYISIFGEYFIFLKVGKSTKISCKFEVFGYWLNFFSKLIDVLLFPFFFSIIWCEVLIIF